MVVPQRRIAVSRLSARGLEYGATAEGARRDSRGDSHEARAPSALTAQQPPNRVESFAALILTSAQPPPLPVRAAVEALNGTSERRVRGPVQVPCEWLPLSCPDSVCVCVCCCCCCVFACGGVSISSLKAYLLALSARSMQVLMSRSPTIERYVFRYVL